MILAASSASTSTGTSMARTLASLEIPGAPGGVRDARSFVRRTLAGRIPDDGVDDVVLVTSELVTNAVEHTRSREDDGRVAITIGLTRDADVRVEVTDDGASTGAYIPGTPTTRVDTLRETGRGLFIVEAYSQACGCIPRPGGRKTVWFVLAPQDT